MTRVGAGVQQEVAVCVWAVAAASPARRGLILLLRCLSRLPRNLQEVSSVPLSL